jgi:DNA-binding NarL/FixJ family response regulator
MARILLVDDHPVFRRGLGVMIGDEPDLEVCGEATDACEALRQVDTHGPDLVIVDVSLRRGHGIDLVKQLHARDRRVKLLVCSMHEDGLFAERALRAGARGYINKREAPEQLIGCIRAVLDGRIYLNPEITQRLLTGGSQPTAVSDCWGVESLSNRELAVFELIGEGLGTRAIAKHLHLSVKTVETYRENVKAKLGLENGAQLARHAAEWAIQRHQRPCDVELPSALEPKHAPYQEGG